MLDDRDRHSRLQKRAEHGEEAGQDTTSLDPINGVEQWAHATDDTCKSYISLRVYYFNASSRAWMI